MSRPDETPHPSPVEAYLADYVAAVEAGEEPPALDDLDDATRADVAELLELLVAADTRDRAPGSDPDVLDRPGAESEFAVAHGFVRPAPDVVVVGPAVRRARTALKATIADLATAMSDRGSEVDGATLDEVERSPACRMPARDARLLAAVLDLPLGAIEATAEPWPADATGLDVLRTLGVEALALGGAAVVRTERGDHLGLLRCSGDATVLDSRTYREVAATLLNGAWSHLAGALLVTEERPHVALAVDALDCVTRSHAPTGLLGYSRLSEPEPVADALESYDRAYAVHWSDPGRLDGLHPGDPDEASAGSAEPVGKARHERRPPTWGHDDLATGIVTGAARLRDEARRARQPGKRPGYEAAARWLATTGTEDVAALLDELARLSPEAVQEQLAEVISP